MADPLDLTEKEALTLIGALGYFLTADRATARDGGNQDLYERIAAIAPLQNIHLFFCLPSDAEAEDGALLFARNSYEAVASMSEHVGSNLDQVYAVPLGFGPPDGTSLGVVTTDRVHQFFSRSSVDAAVDNAKQRIAFLKAHREPEAAEPVVALPKSRHGAN